MSRKNRNPQSLKYEAKWLYSRGDKLNALTLFTEASQIDPSDDYCYFMRGVIVSEVSKLYDSGIEFFKKAISINPKRSIYWDAEANILRILGRRVEAQECLKQAIRLKEIEDLNSKAKLLYKAGNYELAADCYEKITNLDFDNIDACINKGNCYALLNHLDEAKDCYNTGLLRMDSTSHGYFFTKGKCKIYLGNAEGGIEDLEKAVQMSPTSIKYLKALASALSKVGKKEKAIKYYEEIVQLEPYSETLWKSKGELHLALGQLSDALECFDKATKINQNNFEIWKEKGKVYSLLGDHSSALKCFDNGLQISSTDPYLLYGKGKSLYNLERYDDALYCLDQAAKLIPCNFFLLFHKARTLERLGRGEESLRTYRQILEVQTDDFRFLSTKGIALHMLGRTEEAVECYQSYIMNSPSDDIALSRLGTFLLYLGRNEEALEYFNKALEINPNDLLYLCNKALTLIKVGRLEEGKKCSEIAESIDSNNSFVLNLKASIAFLSTDYTTALEYYEKSLKTDSRFPLFALIGRATALLQLRQLQNGLDCIEGARKISPTNINALMVKGQILHELGQYDNSIVCFDTILEMSDEISAWEWKGHNLARKGRLHEAVKCYTEVLKRKNTKSQPRELVSIIHSLSDLLIRNEDSNIDGLIQPRHPFSNEMLMKTTIEKCKVHIYWIDRYFSAEGLKFLNDYMDKTTIKELKILSSIPFLSSVPNLRESEIRKFTKLRELFKDFKKEMKDIYNITCEFKVMQPSLRKEIHDRWILTDAGINFNIPSPDILSRGQSSNIRRTQDAPEFRPMWIDSLDLIDDWNQIEQIMKSVPPAQRIT